jgi:hypothetical protein
MKMDVFWGFAPYSLVEVYRRFRGADDGGSKHLRNVGKLQPDYTAQQPRRQPSSSSVPFSRGTILALETISSGAQFRLGDGRLVDATLHHSYGILLSATYDLAQKYKI